MPAAQLDVICIIKLSYLPEQGGHIQTAYQKWSLALARS